MGWCGSERAWKEGHHAPEYTDVGVLLHFLTTSVELFLLVPV